MALLVTAVLVFSGCGTARPTLKPIVTIVTPAEGARYDRGESINFTIAAAASANVVRVELLLGDVIVSTQINPEPAPTFSTRFGYTPQTQGRLVFSVVAVDGAGASSDAFVVSLLYGQEPTPVPTATFVPIENTGLVSGPNGCQQAATFLQDINVPDGTAFKPGDVFTKTWRMKNISSCDWGEGYTIAHMSDTPMSAVGVAPVRPTPSNANVDVSVSLTAPAEPGIYTSTWRLKDPTGQFFGNRVFVVIRVQ
jgi:hypothetical protein